MKSDDQVLASFISMWIKLGNKVDENLDEYNAAKFFYMHGYLAAIYDMRKE